MRKIVFQLVRILIIVYSNASLLSQSFYVSEIDYSNFPEIKAKFYAFDSDGKLIPNPDITVKENGWKRNILEIKCPQEKPPVLYSSVLTIDVSGSMAWDYPARINIAKAAARAWINSLTPKSECAITSFNDFCYLNQDFTTNKTKLLNAIDMLSVGGGTNYNAAFLNPPAGGLLVAKSGKHKRCLIFLSDGEPNFTPDVQGIINLAIANNVTIYCVTLLMSCPQLLKDIATQTGGQWYENVTTQEQAEAIYRTILQNVKGSSEPCEVRWMSEIDCDENREVTVTLNNFSISIVTNYFVPSNSIKVLEVMPTSLSFGKIPVGKSSCKKVALTARNGDIIINNIFSSNNPPFSISSPTKFPITINKDMTDTLEICYTPTVTDYTYAKITIDNTSCSEKAVYSTGGTPGKKQTKRTLKLLFPNKGEYLYVGIDTLITWEGVTPADTVMLEYSTDSGSTWNLIVDAATGLKYNWSPVPNTPSNQCLARITMKSESTESDAPLILEGHSYWITNASWSPGGSMVATASGDSTAKIWNASTGEIIKNLVGHRGWLNNIAWNKDSTRLLTSSDDSTAIIWDYSSGQPLFTLRGHQGYVYWAEWSPDNSKILTTSRDGTAKVWDAFNGSLIYTLSGPNGHKGAVRYGVWSHLGNRILTASDDNTAKIWDALTGNLLKTLISHNYYINHAAWSSDDSKIALASGDGRASVWNSTTGTRISPLLNHNNQSVNFVLWNKSGDKLLTASDDSLVRIWDGNTYRLISTLTGHNGKVKQVRWNDDETKIVSVSEDKTAIVWDSAGKLLLHLKGHMKPLNYGSFSPIENRVLTASQDYTAIIWNIEPTLLQKQQDVSDSLWSIISPNWTSFDVDLGKVIVGNTKDTIVAGLIKNIGTTPIQINQLNIVGTDANNFKVFQLKTPFILDTNQAKNIGFYFTPSNQGIKNAQIEIISGAGKKIQNLTGEGIVPPIKILTNLVDFGAVEIGNQKEWDSILVQNIGGIAITINSIDNIGPDKTQFNVLNPTSFQIGPGETQNIKLRFKPTNIGRTSGRLAFNYSGLGSPAIAHLYGEGIGGRVYIPDDSAKPGEIISIRLILDKVKPATVQSIAKKFRARLRYQSTILAVNDTSLIKQKSNDSTYIDNTWEMSKNNEIIAQIPMTAGLGNVEQTTIDFDDFQWLDDSGNPVEYNVEIEGGTFKLLGVCKEGGPRLYKANGEIRLMLVKPNPSSSNYEIEFEAIESGKTDLFITNSYGEHVKTITILSPKIGVNTYYIDASDLSSGSYFLTLKTPSEIRTVKFEIIK